MGARVNCSSFINSISYRNKIYWLFIPIISILVLLITWTLDKDIKLSLTNVKPITATDRNEINARYSPDGKFLVFRRNSHACFFHLWAKDLSSSAEFQLTKQPGIYGSIDWSPDGNQLTYTSQSVCNKAPDPTDKCWQLNTLDFSLSLNSPIESVPRSTCKKNRIAVARWVEKGDVALIVSGTSSGNQLQSINLKTGDKTVIYAPLNQKIYSYDYSQKHKFFAVMSISPDNTHQINKIDLKGNIISTAKIQLEEVHSVYEYFNSYFHPSGNFLITYTDLGLFLLDFEGGLTKPDYDVLSQLISPNFHPTENKLIATHLNFDSDIALLKPSTSEGAPINIIARSNVVEVNAQFQPNGNAIAFLSNRTGSRQLWLLNNNKITQISQSELGLQSRDFLWSPTGQNIAVIESDQIVVYGLNKKREVVNSSLPVRKILQWQNNNILIIAKEDNQLFNIGVNDHLITELGIKNAQWAQNLSANTPENQLLYISNDKVFIKTNDEVNQLTGLLALRPLSKVILKKDKLFGINRKKQLWSYDLASSEVTILHNLNQSNAAISDERDNEFLFTFVVSSRKELVEFDVHNEH